MLSALGCQLLQKRGGQSPPIVIVINIITRSTPRLHKLSPSPRSHAVRQGFGSTTAAASGRRATKKSQKPGPVESNNQTAAVGRSKMCLTPVRAVHRSVVVLFSRVLGRRQPGTRDCHRQTHRLRAGVRQMCASERASQPRVASSQPDRGRASERKSGLGHGNGKPTKPDFPAHRASPRFLHDVQLWTGIACCSLLFVKLMSPLWRAPGSLAGGQCFLFLVPRLCVCFHLHRLFAYSCLETTTCGIKIGGERNET